MQWVDWLTCAGWDAPLLRTSIGCQLRDALSHCQATISFELTAAEDGGTLFVLTEELAANHVARNAAGWEACLARLARGVEGPPWQERFDHHVAIFEPVLGAQKGPPEGHRRSC